MTLFNRCGSATLSSLTVAAVCLCGNTLAMAESPAQNSMASAAQQNKFAFIMFYRANDATTQTMYKVLNEELARRNDAVLVPVDIPVGVQQFQADKLNVNRTQLVSLQAGDPAEVRFLQQLKVRPDTRSTVTAFMAPPGVLLGTFNEEVTPAILMTKLAAAGQCCDDPNCKHGRPGTAAKPTTRR